MMFPGGARLCRISNMAIYRALGVENIRHRRKARNSVLMRRLLSLDFVLEHPGSNWLPTEPEKVEFFEGLGISSRLVPRRIYYGDDGVKNRYFTLKLPIAGGAETVTFGYVDPGRESTGELNTWGAAHVPLWDAIRAKGRQIRVVAIAAEHAPIERADRVLRAWAAAPEKDGTGMSVKQEIAAIKDGMLRRFIEKWSTISWLLFITRNYGTVSPTIIIGFALRWPSSGAVERSGALAAGATFQTDALPQIGVPGGYPFPLAK